MRLRFIITCSLIGVVASKLVGEETAFPPWPEYYENSTTETIASKRDAFRDPAKLKLELMQALSINGRFDFEEFPWFKKTFDVQDEVLRPVLLEIFNESKRNDFSDPSNHLERLRAMRSLTGLGICADDGSKQLLISLATEASNIQDLRLRALAAYLQAADPEETKNALLRFLVEGDRMDSMARLGVYGYARMAYDVASSKKRAAITAALIAAANKEECKIEFMKVDKILAERSETYRLSRQRLAMLERHSLEPPTNNLYTDRDLKAALKECRKYRTHTNVSTNLAAFKARNFNLPLPASATNEVMSAEDNNAVVDEKTGNSAKRNVGTYALFGITVLILLGFGAWRLTKKL